MADSPPPSPQKKVIYTMVFRVECVCRGPVAAYATFSCPYVSIGIALKCLDMHTKKMHRNNIIRAHTAESKMLPIMVRASAQLAKFKSNCGGGDYLDTTNTHTQTHTCL